MSKRTNHLHDVIDMLTKLSDHYKDNSLEWAQKKEQYAAEWDEMLDEHIHDHKKVDVYTFDGLYNGYVMECECGDILDV